MICLVLGLAGVQTVCAEAVIGSYKGFSWRISAGTFSRRVGNTHVRPGSRTTDANVPSIPSAEREIQMPGGLGEGGGFPPGPGGGGGEDGGPIEVAPEKSVGGEATRFGGGLSAISGRDPVGVAAPGAGIQSRGVVDTGAGSEWGQSIQFELGYKGDATADWRLVGAVSTLRTERDIATSSFSREQEWEESDGDRREALTRNHVEQSMDFDLETISVGLSRVHRWKGVEYALAAGPTVNLVQSHLSREEAVFVRRDDRAPDVRQEWRDTRSGNTTLLGAFAQGSIMFRLYRVMHAGVLARYDLSQDYKESVGPSKLNTSLDGFTAGVSVSWDL